MTQSPEGGSPQSQRLDKWLWSARFFKTRNLAIDAINGGRVELNGQRSKPAKGVRPGDRLGISRGESRIEVEVLGLAARRGPATEARALYAETEASRVARQRRAEQRRLIADAPVSTRRPNKKQRRQLRDLRHAGDD